MKPQGLPDYYKILGVAEDADPEIIQAAYKVQARRHHTDVPGGNKQRMQELNAARDTLTDPGQRAAYDALRRKASAPSCSSAPPPPPGETPAWARSVGRLLDELGEEGEAAAVELAREGVRIGVGRLKGLFSRRR